MYGRYEDDKWQQVTGADVEPFIKAVSPIKGKYEVKADTAKVEWRMLSFYPSIAMVRVNDSSWGSDVGPFWFLAKQGRMFHLDGTSLPIHEANDAGPIQISEQNVLDYLNFFCTFVHGDEGPFLIIENMNDPVLPPDMDDSVRKVIEDAINPASYDGMTEKGEFQASANVLYGDALFFARFVIYPDGMIEMVDDEPIAADLPVKKLNRGAA